MLSLSILGWVYDGIHVHVHEDHAVMMEMSLKSQRANPKISGNQRRL